MSNIFLLFSLSFASRMRNIKRTAEAPKISKQEKAPPYMTGSPGLLSLCFHNFNSIERVEQKKIIKQLQTFTFWHQYGLLTTKNFLKASINLIGKNVTSSQLVKCDFLKRI